MVLAPRGSVAQRDVGPLGADQAHETLHGVAQQQVAVGGRQEPARQLDQERAEPPLAFQFAPPADHDGELGRDLEGRLQFGLGHTRRHARERRLRAALPLLPAHLDRDAGLAGGARGDGARFVDAAIHELDAGPARPLAEEARHGLPVRPHVLGGGGFGEEAGDRLHHETRRETT
ncbi:MAG: hypothetical protein DMD71_06250 [Gemmatimonadetes bacterium]|nr:MAG: hypothetical protein DMD71_06250 [Gemmatimonadota bacterium]